MRISPNLRPLSFGLRILVTVALAAHVLNYGSPLVAQSEVDQEIQELERALEEIKARARAGENVKARIQALRDELDSLEQQMADDDSDLQQQGEEPVETDETEGPVAASDSEGEATQPQAGTEDSSEIVAEQEFADGADATAVVAESARSNEQLLAGTGRDDPYVDPDFLKSTPLFGSDWRLGFGGYAKVDFLHDFSGTGNEKQFVLATIPVDDDPPPGSYSNLQASETRFHFEVRNTGSKYDNNRFYIEFDFFDEQNPLSVRLRHGYFEYGRLLAGRTWTLLTELRQLPLILDFASGDSILGNRTEQIRWTTTGPDKQFGWAVAVENFPDGAIYNPLGFEGVARSDLPRLTAGFTKLWPQVVWSAGAAVTQLRFDRGQSGNDSSELAYTVTTAGRGYLDGHKRSFIGYGVGYTSGSVTDIITFANGGVPNAALDSEGILEVAKAWNAQIGLHWNWTLTLSSNASLAYAELTEVPEPFEPDFIRTGRSFHLNLIYKFDERITAGLEYMTGERENVSDRDGDAQRLQFSLFYYF